mgnify:CR=1 FL=1
MHRGGRRRDEQKNKKYVGLYSCDYRGGAGSPPVYLDGGFRV